MIPVSYTHLDVYKRQIPGNEKYVSEVINMLYRGGANVIYGSLAKVHVSGHACQEELKMMLALTKPQYFIPVHGEYRHIYNHAALAETMGMKKQNVFISELGREIVIDNRKEMCIRDSHNKPS